MKLDPMVRYLGPAVSALTILAAPAAAQDGVWTAEKAAQAVSVNTAVLVDIRTKEEWAETGVADGAVALSLTDPAFGDKLSKLLGAAEGRPVAFICATGGRSRYVTSVLAQNGITNAVDVSEGMLGNGSAPGWIARDLPLVDAAGGEAALEVLLSGTE